MAQITTELCDQVQKDINEGRMPELTRWELHQLTAGSATPTSLREVKMAQTSKTKKKGLSDAERRRRNNASEKARVFNVKTKGIRDRLKPTKAAELTRIDEGIPLKKHQMPLRDVDMIELQPGDCLDGYTRTKNYFGSNTGGKGFILV